MEKGFRIEMKKGQRHTGIRKRGNQGRVVRGRPEKDGSGTEKDAKE